MKKEQIKSLQSQLDSAKHEIEILIQDFENVMNDDIEIHDGAHHCLTIAECALDDFQSIFNEIKEFWTFQN